MVNTPATDQPPERRQRPRQTAADHAVVLGQTNLNPFGDLHTMQHLSARLARTLRGVFEPLLRRELRVWAEPLVVQRFADYRAERPDGLTGWMPLAMTPAAGNALAVLDGRFVLGMLDMFFGGTGAAPATLPGEFSPAAETLIARIGAALADPLAQAWEPLTRIGFTPGHPEANPALIAGIEADDAMIVTRFGIAADDGTPNHLDLLYPVAALKPHGASLTGKVHGKTAAPDPAWRNALTRAAMGVRFPVRSVLAEPRIALGRLLDLKPGDVIAIDIDSEVPVMIGADRFGTGTVGTANGRAAIKLTSLVPEHEDAR